MNRKSILRLCAFVCSVHRVSALLPEGSTAPCQLPETLSSTLRSPHSSSRRLQVHLQRQQQRKSLRHRVSHYSQFNWSTRRMRNNNNNNNNNNNSSRGINGEQVFARDSICYSAHMLSPLRPSVLLYVCLSVTRVDQSKTLEVRIMQLSPLSSPVTLVSSWLTLPRNSKGNIGSEGAKYDRAMKNLQFSANKSPYLGNGAR